MFDTAWQVMALHCLAALSVAAACPPALGQAVNRSTATGERVRTVLKAAHLAGDFHGVALVALDGRMVYQGAFGLADAEWNLPNAPDVRHGIASLTKSFTAHVVLALADRGVVKLDDALSVHMPAFQGRRIGGITLRQLLSHTAGIGDHLTFVNEEIPAETSKRWEGFSGASIAMFKDLAPYAKLVEVPGARFHYSNDGYVLLGLVVEAVTGKSFEQNLSELLLQPARMAASGINHHKTILPRRARSYRVENGAMQNAPFDDSGSHFSAGGMYSTVGDLYRWDRALRAGSVVSEAAQASMTTPMKGEAWNVFGFRQFGLGWWLKSHETLGRLAMHPGASPQYSAVLIRGLDRDLVIVALANVSSVPSMNKYVPALIEAVAAPAAHPAGRAPGRQRRLQAAPFRQ
jgi:CubicO group peptidase (beta-lactamase class C family)